MHANVIKLNQLRKNQTARILEFASDPAPTIPVNSEDEHSILKRMMEMGLVKGSEVRILHEAPFGKDPIAVEVRGALLGLRREEAELVIVEIL